MAEMAVFGLRGEDLVSKVNREREERRENLTKTRIMESSHHQEGANILITLIMKRTDRIWTDQ